MNTLEALAYVAWEAWGSFAKFTFCAKCGRRGYCRSRGGHRYLCLDCFDQR